MNWFLLVFAAIVGIIAGFFLGVRVGVSSMQPAVGELKRDLANARNFALSTLRRELANWMFQRDPDRYLRVYKETHEGAAAITTANRSSQRAQLVILNERYPRYEDFDLLGTRDHVLYADALGTNSFEGVESHYSDIIRFQALQISLDSNWQAFHATTDSDLEHLERYLHRFKDTLFTNRLRDAIKEYSTYRVNSDGGRLSGAGEPLYETVMFSVRKIPHVAEIRYGVHFKDTDEFGLYTVFYDERSDPFIGFYRSDARFDKEIILDDLLIDESD